MAPHIAPQSGAGLPTGVQDDSKRADVLLARAELGYEIGLHVLSCGGPDK
jgi:hypothetical protein